MMQTKGQIFQLVLSMLFWNEFFELSLLNVTYLAVLVFMFVELVLGLPLLHGVVYFEYLT